MWEYCREAFRPGPVSIIGIDPGTDTLGTAVISFDPVSFDLLRVEARTLVAGRQMKPDWRTEYTGDRMARLQYLKDCLFSLFSHVQPMAVVGESNFMRLTRPQAYGALVESVQMIRSALYEWQPTKFLELYEPNVAKKAVGALNYSDKEAVLKAILKLNLPYVGHKPLETVDSHSSDAIAIALTKYFKLREDAFAINQFTQGQAQ